MRSPYCALGDCCLLLLEVSITSCSQSVKEGATCDFRGVNLPGLVYLPGWVGSGLTTSLGSGSREVKSLFICSVLFGLFIAAHRSA